MKKLLIIGALAVLALSAIPSARAAVRYGDLVKGTGPTVYFVTGDLKRVAFNDEQAFKTWYPDFGTVRQIPDADVAALPFAGLAPLRPGVRPIKAATDARVYAIDRDGALRWLSSESVARMIYGADWASKVAVVSDTELAAYGRGADVTAPGQYWWMIERDASAHLNDVHARRLAAKALEAKPSVTLASATLPPAPTRIIIIPTVVNDNGGYGKEGDVDYLINGALVMPQDGINVLPGTYRLYHGEFPGYAVSAWSGDCAADGTVTVPANATRACFITFDDIPDNLYGSRSNRPPTLTLIASVRNTRGGRLTDQDIKMFIGSMQVGSGFPSTVNADDYTVYRVVPPGYSAAPWTGDCTPEGTVALRNGDQKTCTIVFRD